jgi:electron transfer flavoprotein alpha subunit
MTQGILVIAEHRQQALRPVSLELVTAAQGVRGAFGDKVTVAVIGKGARSHESALSVAGVDELVFVETPDTEFEADTWEAAVTALAEELKPAVVLVAHSVDSMAFAAGLAVKRGWGYATDVFGLAEDGGALVGHARRLRPEAQRRAGVPGPRDGAGGGARRQLQAAAAAGLAGRARPRLRGPKARTRSVAYIEPPSTGDIDMTTREFILSVGRGVGEQDNIERFRELADALGASLGCSRPVADSGCCRSRARSASRQDGRVLQAVRGHGHLRRDPAPGRHEARGDRGRGQHRSQRIHLHRRPLRGGRRHVRDCRRAREATRLAAGVPAGASRAGRFFHPRSPYHQTTEETHEDAPSLPLGPCRCDRARMRGRPGGPRRRGQRGHAPPVAAAAYPEPAAAAAEAPAPDYTLTTNVGLFSQYVFRGISYTQEKPAVQGGADFAHSSGLYAGIWGSNVSSKAINEAVGEIDVYGGWAPTVATSPSTSACCASTSPTATIRAPARTTTPPRPTSA